MVGEGAIPVAVDADDGVRVAVEDLLQLADGLVAAAFGGFASGDVAVVEGDAVVGRKDVNLNPDVEEFVKVLHLLGDASVHDVVADAFELGAQSIGEEFPVGFAVDVGRLDAADSDGFGVGVGDDPVAVEAENGLGNLRDEAREVIVLRVGLTPEASAPIDRDGGGRGHSIEHEYAAKEVMLHLTGELKRNT